MCEQGCPVPVQALVSFRAATRPLGSRRNGAQRHVSEYSREGTERALYALASGGESWGNDMTAEPISQPEAERNSINPQPPPPVHYCTVLHCKEQQKLYVSIGSWYFSRFEGRHNVCKFTVTGAGKKIEYRKNVHFCS